MCDSRAKACSRGWQTAGRAGREQRGRTGPLGRGLQPFPLAGGCTQTPAGRGTCPRSMYPVPGGAVPQPLDLPSAVLPTSCLCWPASPLCVSSARCNSGAARAGPASGVMRQAVIGQRVPSSASARTEGKTWGKHLLFAFVTVGLANLGANDWECLSQNKTKNQTTKKRSAWSCSGCLSRRFSSQGWRRSAEQFFVCGQQRIEVLSLRSHRLGERDAGRSLASLNLSSLVSSALRVPEAVAWIWWPCSHL